MAETAEKKEKKGGFPIWLGVLWLLFLIWIVTYIVTNLLDKGPM